MPKIGNKHAKELGYSRYVDCEIATVYKELADDKVRIGITAEKIPYAIPIIVHKDDILE